MSRRKPRQLPPKGALSGFSTSQKNCITRPSAVRQAGPEDKVALLHMHEARNGAAVEADALFQRLGQVAGQHGDVLLNAKDVTEREADKFYVIVLDEIEDVLLCRIAHSVSS